MNIIKIFNIEKKVEEKRSKSILEQEWRTLTIVDCLEKARAKGNELVDNGWTSVLIRAIRKENEPTMYSVGIAG